MSYFCTKLQILQFIVMSVIHFRLWQLRQLLKLCGIHNIIEPHKMTQLAFQIVSVAP